MRADILHVESIYMSFYWRAFYKPGFYKPGKWAVMYMCVSDTDYASISHF
jgi:hypothetical protein